MNFPRRKTLQQSRSWWTACLCGMVDATLDSPVGRNRLPHWRADTHPGAAVQEVAWRKRNRSTCPEFYNSASYRLRRWNRRPVGRGGYFDSPVDPYKGAKYPLARLARRQLEPGARAGLDWASLAAVAAARAYAASLLKLPPPRRVHHGRPLPPSLPPPSLPPPSSCWRTLGRIPASQSAATLKHEILTRNEKEYWKKNKNVIFIYIILIYFIFVMWKYYDLLLFILIYRRGKYYFYNLNNY